MWFKKVITCISGQSLQHSGCKFFKSLKFEANLFHAIDFAPVELFPVTYLGYQNLKRRTHCRANIIKSPPSSTNQQLFYFNVNQLQDITKEKKCGMITPRIWTSITKIPTNFIPGSLLYKVITYSKNQFGWILQIIRFFDRATIIVFQSRADNILRNEVAWKHSNFAGWTKQNTKIRITQTLGVSFLKY